VHATIYVLYMASNLLCVLFGLWCICADYSPPTHTHTHIYIYIYIVCAVFSVGPLRKPSLEIVFHNFYWWFFKEPPVEIDF
jgi:hypothetical protein